MSDGNDRTIEPRLLTRKQAAAYCGVSAPTFTKWVLAGTVPDAVPGTGRWDKKALDAHLDKLSGIGAAEEPEDPFLKWKREYDARKAAQAAAKQAAPPVKPGKGRR